MRVQKKIIEPEGETKKIDKIIENTTEPIQEHYERYKQNTDHGFLSGIQKKYKYDKNGGKYYAFLGIPYAKPPLGSLRFKDPEPVAPWNDILDASKEKNMCPQKASTRHMESKVIGSEDCLYLNIYTPHKPDSIKTHLPVMIWIHGGGFQMGSGNSDFYGPDFLIKNEVILVTFNYRLGVLGFLNLQILDAPGNVGLKDQVMVLKWIKSNISKFGGDPDNITLFGEDAGAVSIQILVEFLDLEKNKLFHKIILQSGSIMNPWAFTTKNKENAINLAESVGIQNGENNFLRMVDSLRTMTAEDIVINQDNIVSIKDIENLNLFPFVPSVESKSNITQNTLMNQNPLLHFASGKIKDIPTILGFNNGEANIAFLYYSELIDSKMMNSLNSIPDAFISSLFDISDASAAIANAAKNTISKFYFGGKNISWNNIPEFLQLLSDGMISVGMFVTTEIMKNKKVPFYVYEFTMEGDLNYFGNAAKEIFKIQNEKEKSQTLNTTAKIHYDNIHLLGAAHADELGYLFLMNQYDKELSPDKMEYKLREKLSLMWTNFAKKTEPNENNLKLWNNCTKENPFYLSIGETINGKNFDVDKKSFAFWRSIFFATYQGNLAYLLPYL